MTLVVIPRGSSSLCCENLDCFHNLISNVPASGNQKQQFEIVTKRDYNSEGVKIA